MLLDVSDAFAQQLAEAAGALPLVRVWREGELSDRQLESADAVVIELLDGQASPLETTQAIRARAPFAQLVFLGNEASLSRARQKLLLVGGLTDRWTFLRLEQPETWQPALAEASERAGRRRELRGLATRLTASSAPGQAPLPTDDGVPQLASVVSHMHEAVLILDLRGLIRYANPAAAALYGESPERLRDSALSRFVQPECLVQHEQLLAACNQGEIDCKMEAKHRHVDGHGRDVEVSASPLKDWRGQLTGHTLLIRDISERLAAQRAEVLEAERQAAVAHAEELQALNEELTAQAEELEAQQHEMAQLNDELRRQNDRIEAEVKRRTAELVARTEAMARQNEQLAVLNEAHAAQAEELQAQARELARHQQELEASHREALAQKELTERIVQSAPAGISYMNRNLVYEWVNPTQARLWGIPAAQVVGRSVKDVFGLTDDNEVLQLLKGVFDTGEPCHMADFPFTYQVDGHPRTTLWDFTYQAVRGQAGYIVGVLVIANEVTERKQAEAILRESEERYKSLFETNRDAIVMAGLDRGIQDVNPAFVKMFGYTLDEMPGKSTESLYPSPESFLAIGKQALGDLSRREPLVLEAEMKRKDGTVFPVELNSYLVRDAQGRPARVVAVLRDLTEPKRAQAQMESYTRQLAAQKAFAESLIQNLPTGVAYVDRDLVFRVVNPVYSDFLQIPADELIGRFVFDALPTDRSAIEPILQEVLDTGKPFYASEFPFTYSTPDGTERTTYWNFVYYPVRESDEQPVQGIFALADEISDRVEQQREQRRLQEEHERLQQERLEALVQADKLKDQFLSVLSHELRTPINAIMGFGSVLDDEVLGPLTAEQHNYTAKILTSADALLALIEDLLIISRVQAGKFSVSPEPVHFDELVHDALATQQFAADKKAIALVTQVPEGLPPLEADPLRVKQVLNNLVGNAIKFTPNCGQVVVRARIDHDLLRCEVSDTGIGIAQADLPKLFQRFVQLDMSNTRAAGGTGLGLSIVKAIVDAHDGTVGVESQAGVGSTFWFELPLSGPKASHQLGAALGKKA